ncbi:MAG: Lrp/AsnC ligand binding domain-containing protein [Nitrososphaerales archaeon]|jgi:DNA-binding Lrp family transcriptional regulator
MPKAFVLINAELGAEDSLIKELKNTENVSEVYVVYGVYDIVAKIEADTMEKVKETITWKIRRLERVRSTLTMIVVEG